MENGFELLPILPGHIIRNNLLEYHHRDPFDRMIIVQELSDEKSKFYGRGNFKL